MGLYALFALFKKPEKMWENKGEKYRCYFNISAGVFETLKHDTVQTQLQYFLLITRINEWDVSIAVGSDLKHGTHENQNFINLYWTFVSMNKI